MPQIILFDPAHVNAVVGEPPSVYIVKPVDQIGDGGFSSPCRAYKGNLLPRLRIKADVLENGVSRFISKVHMFKLHISPQGNQLHRSVCPPVLPGPKPRPFPRFLNGSVRTVFSVYQSDGSLIDLRLLIHSFKDPLCTGHGGQHKIGLEGKLVNRHGRLADKDKIAGKASHIRPAL